jgi:hypothetical protein
MSRAKDKGTSWETAWVRYLREHGVPHAERRALAGNVDRGDIAGIPGIVLECKSGAFHLAQWISEAEQERANDGADLGIVLAKRAGKASPADGYAILTGAALVQLLQAAGYIAAPPALPQPLRVVEPLGQRVTQVDIAVDLSDSGLLEALRGLVARYDPPPAVAPLSSYDPRTFVGGNCREDRCDGCGSYPCAHHCHRDQRFDLDEGWVDNEAGAA